jgi:hypothetical protein
LTEEDTAAVQADLAPKGLAAVSGFLRVPKVTDATLETIATAVRERVGRADGRTEGEGE